MSILMSLAHKYPCIHPCTRCEQMVILPENNEKHKCLVIYPLNQNGIIQWWQEAPVYVHPLNQNGIIEWGQECRFHICRGRRSACSPSTPGCCSTRGHSARSCHRPPQDTPLEHTQHTGHFAVGNTAFFSRN